MATEPRQLPLGDVTDLSEENLFDANITFNIGRNNRWRDIASQIVRNALSKAILKGNNRAPNSDDLVSGQSQVWLDTSDGSLYLSLIGEAWVEVTGDGENGWTPVFAIETHGTRRVVKIVNWTGGEGTKPAVNQYLSATGFVSDVASAVDIRGPQGVARDGNDGTNGWSPEFAIESDDDRQVLKVVDWDGGSGTKPDIDQYVGSEGFVSDIADAVDIRGLRGLPGQADDGDDGDNGWTPVFAIEAHGARRVLKVVNWTGGEGSKPAIDQYVSATGFVSDIESAIDIRGPQGLQGIQGIQGLQGEPTEVEVGKATAVGSWEQTNTNPPVSDGLYRATSGGTLQVRFVDDDIADRQAALEASEAGDVINVGGLDGLVLSAAPTIHSNRADFTGTWLNGYDDTLAGTTGDTHVLYRIKKNDRIGKNARSPGKIVGVANDLNLEFIDRASGQQDDGTPSDSSVETGVYSDLGTWAVSAQASPATGEFSVGNQIVYISDTNSGSTSKATEIGALGVGDRVQFGGINAFVLTAAPTITNGVATLAGDWTNTFVASAFNGNAKVYTIKKNNVLAHNSVVEGRFLKIGNNLLVEAQDPDDSFETIWEGTLDISNVLSGTFTQVLNAGKKFSDYTHIIFQHQKSTQKYHDAVLRAEWVLVLTVEFGNRLSDMSLFYINDTSFRLSGVGSSIELKKLIGYKGV